MSQGIILVPRWRNFITRIRLLQSANASPHIGLLSGAEFDRLQGHRQSECLSDIDKQSKIFISESQQFEIFTETKHHVTFPSKQSIRFYVFSVLSSTKVGHSR